MSSPLTNPVTVNNPVSIQYANRGNSLVRHILVIDDEDPTTAELVYINNQPQLHVAPGTYTCVLTTRAYIGALGNLCDSDIKINGQLVAKVGKPIPDGAASSEDVTTFTLIVRPNATGAST